MTKKQKMHQLCIYMYIQQQIRILCLSYDDAEEVNRKKILYKELKDNCRTSINISNCWQAIKKKKKNRIFNKKKKKNIKIV